MQMKLTLISFFMILISQGTVLADEEPDVTFNASCAACHGENGASNQSDVPIIGGLSAFALEENLFAFKHNERPCRDTFYRNDGQDRPNTNMCKIAAQLSDDQIVEIAAYLASQPFVAATQETDPEKVARGSGIHDRLCRHCHGKGGSDPADHASILAGQWMPYLALASMNFKAGKRWMPRNMERRLKKLSDDDVMDLIHFYGSEGYQHDSN
jgi:sulfide dehydrogenase cytochrome subunit